MPSNQTIAELSADAAMLISEFSKKPRGSVISYEEIEKIIGWDIRRNRGLMATVRNRLLRDHSIVLGVVYNTGYKLLNDSEIVGGALPSDRERRRKSAVRSKRKAGAVDFGSLKPVEQLKCLAEITAAHVTIEASGDKSVKQIEGSLNGHSTPLALNKALEALKHNIK